MPINRHYKCKNCWLEFEYDSINPLKHCPDCDGTVEIVESKF